MNEESVESYFQTLSNLMLTIEVTDHKGHALSLNDGAGRAVDVILANKLSGQKIMLVGNGGSSAIVSHVQNDLCKAVGVKSMVFTEQPLLTALSNDDGYGSVFEKPIYLWGNPGDILISVSSSGRSENVVRALGAASEIGCHIITLSGFAPDNPSRTKGELNFYVNSDRYGFVETAHAALLHFVTDYARNLVLQDNLVANDHN